MSKKGYVATSGGFCVAISSRSVTDKTTPQNNAVNSTDTTATTESTAPSVNSTRISSIKKSA